MLQLSVDLCSYGLVNLVVSELMFLAAAEPRRETFLVGMVSAAGMTPGAETHQ